MLDKLNQVWYNVNVIKGVSQHPTDTDKKFIVKELINYGKQDKENTERPFQRNSQRLCSQ